MHLTFMCQLFENTQEQKEEEEKENDNLLSSNVPTRWH